jgi:N-acetylglucosamine malate deacetylase 1
MKLDLLVFAAHPDDAELGVAGTIIKHVRQGYKVGIVDFTEGELGTRGTPEIRLSEAAAASEIMGLSARLNAGFKDGFFQNDETHQRALIRFIREFQPEVVIGNAVHDRHPDHGRAASLCSDACFLSGLRRIETEWGGQPQAAWRPKQVYHYIQDRYIKPDFIVDISDEWPMKKAAIQAYASQFFNLNNTEPESYISTKEFWDFVESRYREMGHIIGATHGEGFTVERTIGVDGLFQIR